MATTLAQALSNYNTQYLNALATKSKRDVERLDQGWQQINNYWDIYLQASAEGNTTMTTAAITGITNILGGVIDVSTLPVITGGLGRVGGVVSVTPTYQKIPYSRDLGTTSYVLNITLLSATGVPVGYVRGAKDTDGFYITPSFASILDYSVTEI